MTTDTRRRILPLLVGPDFEALRWFWLPREIAESWHPA